MQITTDKDTHAKVQKISRHVSKLLLETEDSLGLAPAVLINTLASLIVAASLPGKEGKMVSECVEMLSKAVAFYRDKSEELN